MSIINREEALRLIADYQGGAVDKTIAKRILIQMPEEDELVHCRECVKKGKCTFYDLQGDGGYCRYGKSKDGSLNPQVLERCVAKIQIDGDQIKDIVDKAIIRCKDCKHWTLHKRLGIPWCRELHIDRGADDFCSCAERRTDGVDS